MALNASSLVLTHPHYMMPELIHQAGQQTGAFNLLPDGDIEVRLGESDLYAYAKTVGVRHRVKAGTSPSKMLPGVDVYTGLISTPSYLIQCQTNYNHHDLAAAGNWGIPLDEAYRLGARQGFGQALRDALLYGFNPANSEGIVNAPGATWVNLPADTGGNTTIRTYDQGQLAVWFLQQITNLVVRMYQLGLGGDLEILASQQVLGAIGLYRVVQLTSYQREGAGSATIGQMIENLAKTHNINVSFHADDTLSTYASGGETIIICQPEIKVPSGSVSFATNDFQKLRPGQNKTLTMLADMAAPREIKAPLPDGGTNTIYEMRSTPGWVLRGEAITIINAPF